MKILLLADSNSSHTIKWVKALSQRGIKLCVFGLQTLNHDLFDKLENVKCYSLDSVSNKKEGAWSKLSYLKALPLIKKIIREEKPDLVHAHYASSYGLLGALSNFHPYVLSVWGSDVFSFPKKSFLHEYLLRYNLSKADALLSTSETMALECKNYTSKEIFITPFGVDLKKFTMKRSEEDKQIVGTVKALENKYGIDILIRAFAALTRRYPNLELHIVGDGQEKEALTQLAKDLDVSTRVKFLGKIENDQVPEVLHSFTVYAAFSRCEESFGVAIVEAQACGTAVIVSRMGGLIEVVNEGVTGLAITNESVEDATAALDLLLSDENLRKKLAVEARANVEQAYDWERNVDTLEEIYRNLVS